MTDQQRILIPCSSFLWQSLHGIVTLHLQYMYMHLLFHLVFVTLHLQYMYMHLLFHLVFLFRIGMVHNTLHLTMLNNCRSCSVVCLESWCHRQPPGTAQSAQSGNALGEAGAEVLAETLSRCEITFLQLQSFSAV